VLLLQVLTVSLEPQLTRCIGAFSFAATVAVGESAVD